MYLKWLKIVLFSMLKNDILYYGLIKAFSVLFWIIILKLNAVYLKPIDFANFTISLNIGIFIAILITGWQSASFLRYYYEEEDKVFLYAVVIKETFKIVVFSTVLFLFIIWISFFYYYDYFFILLNSFVMSLAYTSFLLITNILRIKRQLRRYLFLTIIFTLISLILYLILIDKYGWCAGLISICISYILISTYVCWKKRNNIKLIFNILVPKKYKTKLMKYGLPIILIGLSSQVMSTVDVLLLKLYGFEYEAGIYSANYSIAEKSIFALLSIMATAFTPIIFKKSREKGFNIFLEVQNVTKLFLYIAIPIVLLISYFAKDICVLLLDVKYVDGFYIIPYIAFSGIFVGIANFYSEILTVEKKTILLAKIYLYATLFNIVVNIAFIPSYGINAAIISTCLTYIILMVIIIISSKLHKSINYPSKYDSKI